MENCVENAGILKAGIESTGRFDIVSKDTGVPLIAFKLKDGSQHSVFEISESLRRFGWIVPAYTMPPDAEHVAVLRVVIREDFSRSLAERLVADLRKVVSELDTLPTRIQKIASVAAEMSGNGGTVPKKSVKEMQEEITGYWKRAVEKKKATSGVC